MDEMICGRKWSNRARAIAVLVAAVLFAAFFAGGCGGKEDAKKTRSDGGAGTAVAASDPRSVCDSVALMAGLRRDDALLGKQDILPAGSPVSDWMAMAFAFSGRNDDYDAYLHAIDEYVTQKYATEEKLDRHKATEWHRISLTILALGGDPTAVGQDPDGNPVNLIADGTYDYDGDLSLQGVNGAVFALITLDALDYAVPDGSAYTRESILNSVLDAQNEDGGFGLAPGASDVDLTAMALLALARYQDDPRAARATDAALSYLSEQQCAEGDFVSFGVRNSESVSQTIIALCALGIDPDGDGRFIKNGTGLREALMSYQDKNGGFRHEPSEDANPDMMATEQAVLALYAMERLADGNGNIYNFIAPEANTGLTGDGTEDDGRA